MSQEQHNQVFLSDTLKPLNDTQVKWPEPTDDEPDLDDLQEYTMDSVCPATDGCIVEPDGVCEHGHPSWLLKLGYV